MHECCALTSLPLLFENVSWYTSLAQSVASCMSHILRFRTDQTFTLVQFTDLHWKNGEPEDLKTRALMEQVLELEKPDLVLLTGDVIEGGSCADPARSWRGEVGA